MCLRSTNLQIRNRDSFWICNQIPCEFWRVCQPNVCAHIRAIMKNVFPCEGSFCYHDQRVKACACVPAFTGMRRLTRMVFVCLTIFPLVGPTFTGPCGLTSMCQGQLFLFHTFPYAVGLLLVLIFSINWLEEVTGGGEATNTEMLILDRASSDGGYGIWVVLALLATAQPKLGVGCAPVVTGIIPIFQWQNSILKGQDCRGLPGSCSTRCRSCKIAWQRPRIVGHMVWLFFGGKYA